MDRYAKVANALNPLIEDWISPADQLRKSLTVPSPRGGGRGLGCTGSETN